MTIKNSVSSKCGGTKILRGWEVHRFELAYYCANQVYESVIRKSELYLDDDIFESFLCGSRKPFVQTLAKPNKHTVLHDYIYNVYWSELDYITGHAAGESIDWFQQHFENYSLEIPKWLNEEEVKVHIRELDERLGQVTHLLAKDCFYLLYCDRGFLKLFNDRVSSSIRKLKVKDNNKEMKSDGVLKRPSNVPSWLKRAVFFREKGRCANCLRDISGQYDPQNSRHFDHIVPLAKSGSNDPTNFQLTCIECNLDKGSRQVEYTSKYPAFW